MVSVFMAVAMPDEIKETEDTIPVKVKRFIWLYSIVPIRVSLM